MTTKEESTFDMTVGKFKNRGHKIDFTPERKKGTMWIYDTCKLCGVSLYLWAVNGQFECEKGAVAK